MAAKSPAKFPAQTGAQTPSPSLKRNLVFERFAAWEEAGLCERLVDSTRTAYDSAMRRFEAKLAKLPSLEGKEFLAMSVLGIDLDGKGNTDKALKIPQIGDYLQRFFQVPVHLGTRLSLAGLGTTHRDWDKSNKRFQYDAEILLEKFLFPTLPKEAFLHAGLSVDDLMMRHGHGLVTGVAGLADPQKRSCVVTLRDSKPSEKHYLPRVLGTLTHEICHALGLDHCEHYKCLMNEGCETLEDNDKTPLLLCPLCTEKLRVVLPNIDELDRVESLRGFCKEHKSLKKEEKELEKLAKFLTMTKLFSPRKKNKEQKRDLKRPREEEKEEGKVEMMEKKEKKAVAEADEVILHAELVEETAGKKPSKRRRFS